MQLKTPLVFGDAEDPRRNGRHDIRSS